jgi:hypothetical protein
MEPVVCRLSMGAIYHPVSVVLRLINRMKGARHLGRVGVSSSLYRCGLSEKVRAQTGIV